ncbi:MAG TPA: hypothetical protein VN688_27895 [Gemmataceae bacterium]|nr:hypothetical protein [Gemmataceae bacterium]
MTDQAERTLMSTHEIAQPETMPTLPRQEETSVNGQGPPVSEAEIVPVESTKPAEANGAGVEDPRWQVRAGREGARRVHQLIQEGKQYEKEHGLKKGRQRLRQLIELGKRYEQEHGLRPIRPKNRSERLSRMGRQELMETLLQCLVRIAKPSLRAELTRLVEVLHQADDGHAA